MTHSYSPTNRTPYDEPNHSDHPQADRRHGSVFDSLSNNPIPLALVGVGLGWLALSSTGYDRRIARSRTVRAVRHRAEDAADYARDTLNSATDRLRGAASSAYDSAREAVGEAAEDVADRMASHRSASHRSGHSVSERMHSVTASVWDMVEEHPVVVGALGIALGAAIGAALPGTRYENRWVGEYADDAVGQARSLSREALDRGTRAARAAEAAVKDEVTGTTTREEATKPA